MWTHVISVGVSTCGCWGNSSTVAGTSVSDSAPTSRAPAASVGQASGQTTRAAVASVPAPSSDAMSRRSRHGRVHVPRAPATASHPNRPRYAATGTGQALYAHSSRRRKRWL